MSRSSTAAKTAETCSRRIMRTAGSRTPTGHRYTVTPPCQRPAASASEGLRAGKYRGEEETEEMAERSPSDSFTHAVVGHLSHSASLNKPTGRPTQPLKMRCRTVCEPKTLAGARHAGTHAPAGKQTSPRRGGGAFHSCLPGFCCHNGFADCTLHAFLYLTEEMPCG